MKRLAQFALAMGLTITMAMAQDTAPSPPPAAPPTPPAAAHRPDRPHTPPAAKRADYPRSYLGISTEDVTPETASGLKLKEPRGVEVLMVDHDAPAGKAGLHEHDVILSYNGQRVETVRQLRALIRKTAPGQKATLGISRDGQPMQLTATIQSRGPWALAGNSNGVRVPAINIPAINIPPMEFEFPQIRVVEFSSHNGLMVEDLTPQLGEFFGIRSGEGVLVRSVQPGSAAAAAGLKAGDVITKVEGEPVACTTDWRAAMREHRSGTVSLNIIRDKREQTVSLKLPERHSSNVQTYRVDIPEISMDFSGLERNMEELKRAQEQASRELERAMREMQRELNRSLRTYDGQQ